MQKFIQINNQKLEYTLRINNRSRGLKISIHPGGECFVTVPRFVPQFMVNSFIKSKADWIIEKIKFFSKFKSDIQTKSEKHSEYQAYKDKALRLVIDRLNYFNKYYNFHWHNVVIKNQKSRWGSCSSRGNLNFNYKIAQLPPKSADYIIIHELCHLGELNHSKRFWALVSKTMPDYQVVRKNINHKNHIL